MKAKELREKTVEELQSLEKQLLTQRFEVQFKNQTNQLDDTTLLRKTRRDIARAKTILAEKARAEKSAKPA